MNTIVIVDDQPINRSVYSKIAASIEEGVDIKTFADPREALDYIVASPPALVITDYKMPVMNGATLIRRIRAEPSLTDIPIIVITVFEEKSYRFRALDAGATDFLLSPVDHREFVTRARNLMRLRRQQLLLADRAQNLERRLQHSELSLQQAVRDSSERLAQVIDAVPALISATDRAGRYLFINAGKGALIGIDPRVVVGRDLTEIHGEEYGARSKALDRLVIQGGKAIHSFEEEIVDRAGATRVFQTTKSPLNDAAGETIGVVTSSLDITERKSAERHLQFMAHYDPLTGLPNRAFLSERMGQEIVRARRGDRHFALLVVDVDGLKGINDVMGHAVGDSLLILVAKRLSMLKRGDDVVARIGGDEFAILLTGLSDHEAVEEHTREIARAMRLPLVMGEETASITVSIGIALHPHDGADTEDLLRNADLAMYRAKSEGGDQHRFYASDMNVRASQAAALDADLRRAIDRGEFVLHYQPQVRLQTGEVVGLEALLRWQRPDGSFEYPGRFLPRAEQNGLILPINEWVLRTACAQAAAWKRAGLPRLRMSVNMSPIQFRKRTLVSQVTGILEETKLDPHALDLELTENILMQDIEQVAAQLKQLRELGVLISIDDFGTGFSSLSYVKRLPVDRLKIDQSFVRDLSTDPSDRAIVGAIVNLAHSLSMEVTAEGVETEEQLQFVRAAGCDEVQGYYYGRPMSAAVFEAFIAPDHRCVGAG